MKRTVAILAVVLGGLVTAASVGTYTAYQSLSELERRGTGTLELASGRVVGALFSYRLLANTLASDPRLLTSTKDEITTLLLHAADVSGALDFILLDQSGEYQVSVSGNDQIDYLDTALVSRAQDGSLGRMIGMEPVSESRAYFYATPVFSDLGPVAAILVTAINLERIEGEFRGSRPAIYMSDDSGIIHFSNRSELVLRDRRANEKGLPSFVEYRPRDVFGFEIWSVTAGRYLPALALHLEQGLPVIGMRAEALVDAREAVIESARLAFAAGAVVWLLGAIIYISANQRRFLADANVRLESRVAARTSDLRAANASLREEVAERIEAESALKRAQSELVQAEKLSALGKMSAGISHELNQPLMAIQSFAENAEQLITRGDTQTAQRNIGKIADLSRRMARIIKNFRSFARQESENVKRIDLNAIVESAIELAQQRIEKEGVELHISMPQTPVWVAGGEVRMQQVVLNLLSNAVDAMVGSERRELSISIKPGAAVRLTVDDSGPGIKDVEKVFEPFYSTKQIGEAEGVGLGLSISYGLVQSFGGKISGSNKKDGGAKFVVELKPWPQEDIQ